MVTFQAVPIVASKASMCLSGIGRAMGVAEGHMHKWECGAEPEVGGHMMMHPNCPDFHRESLKI